MDQKPGAEKAAEDLDRKEERVSASDPARVVRADSAAGHDAVNVRRQMEILAPSMEHGQQADGRAQMLGVRCDAQQRLRNGAEEDRVDDPGVLKGQPGNLLRYREDYVKLLLHRQQFSFAFGQPLGAGRCLTLRTAPISTRVIRDGAMPALVALFDMAA
jgi:hypothetical protein